MDDPENPSVDEAPAVADTPQDPVQAAKDDAWLAQFRADNAAKVMEHNYNAAADDVSKATGAEAESKYDLKRAAYATKTADQARIDAAAEESKAQADAARHDEYEFAAQKDRHLAAEADDAAATYRAAAAAADKQVGELEADATELNAIYVQHAKEYEVMQEQAVAAQRIATDEAKLPHPGDPAPADHPTE